MALSKLLAGIWFVLWAAVNFGWFDVSNWLMGVIAVVVGVLWILEALGVYTVSFPVRRKTVVTE